MDERSLLLTHATICKMADLLVSIELYDRLPD
jgi:hypothetical protein